MKAVNADDVLKILHKYGKYIFVTDEKRYSYMVDEIANLKALEQQLCEDCISRQAVLSYISNDLGFGNEENGYDLERKIAQEEIYNFVKKMHIVTPKEKTGKWINEKWHGLDLIGVTCSNCNVVESRFSAYCPNCGAKMVEPSESEG